MTAKETAWLTLARDEGEFVRDIPQVGILSHDLVRHSHLSLNYRDRHSGGFYGAGFLQAIRW